MLPRSTILTANLHPGLGATAKAESAVLPGVGRHVWLTIGGPAGSDLTIHLTFDIAARMHDAIMDALNIYAGNLEPEPDPVAIVAEAV